MEFGGKGFVVGVFGKTMFGFVEKSLRLGLKDYFSRAHRGIFGDEVVLVNGF